MKPAQSIVIIGAGPAGIAAARTLADAGLRPVVIDEVELRVAKFSASPSRNSRDRRAISTASMQSLLRRSALMWPISRLLSNTMPKQRPGARNPAHFTW